MFVSLGMSVKKHNIHILRLFLISNILLSYLLIANKNIFKNYDTFFVLNILRLLYIYIYLQLDMNV